MGAFYTGCRIDNHTDRSKSAWIPSAQLEKIKVKREKKDIRLPLLGSRTLEGLNLTVDPARKKLVAAGPVPAA